MIFEYIPKDLIFKALQWTGENHDEVKGFIPYDILFEDGDILLAEPPNRFMAYVSDWILKDPSNSIGIWHSKDSPYPRAGIKSFEKEFIGLNVRRNE